MNSSYSGWEESADGSSVNSSYSGWEESAEGSSVNSSYSGWEESAELERALRTTARYLTSERKGNW